MALPAVHKAPPGTDAMDAGWVARWLTGGGLMVVCPRDRCMHVGGVWEHGCVVGARPQWIPENTEKLRNVIFEKFLPQSEKGHGVSGEDRKSTRLNSSHGY